MKPRVPVTIEARLGYRNKGDAPDAWKEYASSTELRTMDCSPPDVTSFHFLCECHSDCFFYRKMAIFTTVHYCPFSSLEPCITISIF